MKVVESIVKRLVPNEDGKPIQEEVILEMKSIPSTNDRSINDNLTELARSGWRLEGFVMKRSTEYCYVDGIGKNYINDVIDFIVEDKNV